MTEPAIERWVFNRRELWMLLQSFAPAVMVGVVNPYFGWEAERRAADQRETWNALRARGIKKPFSLLEETPLRAALALMARPERTLVVLTQFKNETQKRRFFHFRGKAIVEHADEGEEQQVLTLLPGKDFIPAELAHDLRLDTPLAAEGPMASIDEESFLGANRAFRKGDPAGAQAILVASGADEASVRVAGRALADPAANASAALLADRGDPAKQSVRGLAVLEGGGGIWILRPTNRDGRRKTEMIPASAEKIRTAFNGLLL